MTLGIGPAQVGAPTRDRLLAAVWRVIRAEGMKAATSRRITTEAGVNLGAITYYFGSKDALVGEAVAERVAAWTAPLGAALLHDEAGGGNDTDVFIAGLFDTDHDRADVAALFEVLFGARQLPEVQAALRDRLVPFHGLVAGVMQRMKDRGEIPTHVLPEAMAGVFTSFALGLMVLDVIGARPASPAEITGQLLSLLVTTPGGA